MLSMDSRSTCHWRSFCRTTFCLPPISTGNRSILIMVIHCAVWLALFLDERIWKRRISGKVPNGCGHWNLCRATDVDFGNRLVITTERMFGKKNGSGKNVVDAAMSPLHPRFHQCPTDGTHRAVCCFMVYGLSPKVTVMSMG